LFIVFPLLRIVWKRFPCAAAPSIVKGGCETIFSVGVSANADVNCAGFFIASALRRCQATAKNFLPARVKMRNAAQDRRAGERGLKKSMEKSGLSV
jgi:hypothetical protein